MDGFLGIDIGTKMVKALVVDIEGNVLSRSAVDVYHLTERPQPSWAQRDVNKLWTCIKKMLSQLRGQDHVRAICVDGTSGTVVPIDKNGHSAYPALMHSDERAIEETEELRKKSEKAVEFEKVLPIAPYLVLPKIMWLRKNTDSSKWHKILHENDFAVFKLTDEIVTSPNIAGKSHADLKDNRYMREIYEDLDVNLDLMPPIKPVGDVVGHVTEEASSEMGIPAGTPVVNGMTDASASDIATGTLRHGQVNANIGTSLTLHAVVKEAAPDPEHRFYYKAYLEHTYLAGGATNAGTLPLDALSKLLKKPLQELDKMAEETTVGCDGLIAQPEWVGTRLPRSYPNARGFFVNVDERTLAPGHLYRSLLEGNSLVLNRLLTIIGKITKTTFHEVRTCGGGAKSKIQNKIIADATGIIVRNVKEGDAALGSAILAMHGVYRNVAISEIASKVVKVEAEYKPNPVLKEKYLEAEKKLGTITEFIGETMGNSSRSVLRNSLEIEKLESDR